MGLKSAVWFISWNCNYSCNYCWQRQQPDKYSTLPYISSEEWAEAWNRLKPEMLDITGGEPFLQPNFHQLLELLDPSIKVAITTNLSQDMSQFAQRFQEKVTSMTLSYHPTQLTHEPLFWGRVSLLKNRGFENLTVNFVGYPDQMWLKDYVKAKCSDAGVRFHLDPYAIPEGSQLPFNPNRTELLYLAEDTLDDRKAILEKPSKRRVFCEAGLTHIQVHPDGTAYRCGVYSTYPKILGSVFDSGFRLYLPDDCLADACVDSDICFGCDRDKVSGGWREL
jgi:MoaA/NifB/PqqE/SkfB family radical SAM enzyme